MKIEKAHWTTDGDNIRLTMPLQKVDKKRRIVSGFATVEAEDKHGDVVTKEASRAAWADFIGNLRLMHQPIPAGRVLNFREEQYYDSKTNQVYDGIYVDAYVSKGAENVWEMVLDGTLTGFSIGGDNVEAETKFTKDNRPVRYVTSYRMNELSLVDNPANQYSNILSIQKSADGESRVEGSLADVRIENVFYCKKGHDPVALVGPEESKTCLEPGCGSEMKNIGWFETDGGDKAEKVSAIIQKFESTEGGDNMPQEENEDKVVEESSTVETAEEVSPKGDAEVVAPEEETEESATATNVEEENVTVTGTGESKVEEAKEVVQPETPDGEVVENPLTKMFDDLHVKIDEVFTKSATQQTEALAAVTTQFENKFTELANSHAELSKKFGELTEKLDGMEKRFETVEKSGAFKKSADLGGSEESSSIKKGKDSFWRGALLNT